MNTIEDTLRPLLRSMKLLGLYHDVGDNSNTVSPLDVQKTRHWKKVFNSGTYSVVVVLLLWSNFVRYSVALFPRDAGFTNRVVVLGWFWQCASNATIMYFACAKLTNIPAFMKHWNILFDDSLTTQGSCRKQFSKKYVSVATVTAWMMFAFNSIGVLYLMNSNLEQAYVFRSNIIKPFPDCTVTLVVLSILHVVETGAWVFPVIYLVTVSYTIKLNFDNFSIAFEKHINESENGPTPNLKCFRSRHLKMCQSVAILDRVFMYLNAVSFGSNIVLCCFVLYDIVNTAMDPMALTMNIFWLGSSLCSMLANAISASQVNDAAHSALEHIFKIQPRGTTTDDLSQLHLFSAKLTGTTVGFTILNILVITKELILTIGGALVTYFFLLFQFRIN